VKRLTLMRHANAKWKDREVADFERPLNRRGNSEAEAMGRRLAELNLIPDLILTSAATRTRQTADIVAKELKVSVRHVRSDESLYLAKAKDILAAIHGTGPRVPHLLVVGHNPGISKLADQLGATYDDEEFPTGALCSLTIDTRSWSSVAKDLLRESIYEAPPAGLFSALGF
jgi:phosphohistidine phosphatase